MNMSRNISSFNKEDLNESINLNNSQELNIKKSLNQKEINNNNINNNINYNYNLINLNIINIENTQDKNKKFNFLIYNKNSDKKINLSK